MILDSEGQFGPFLNFGSRVVRPIVQLTMRRFLQKSKNSQHSSVPDGGPRGTRLALRRRRDIEKTVEKNPLNIYSM